MVYSPKEVDSIEATLSVERLAPYVKMAAGEKRRAVKLYERNTQLSQSLYSPLQAVEVAVRNTFNEQLCHRYGFEWFDALPKMRIFQPNGYDRKAQVIIKLQDARDRLRKFNKKESDGRIVAELSFGFWTGLCAARYTSDIWINCLNVPFRKLRLSRQAMFERLDQIRVLRNRVAHHEPILSRDLVADHRLILDTIRWVCPITADWAESKSTFPARFAEAIV